MARQSIFGKSFRGGSRYALGSSPLVFHSAAPKLLCEMQFPDWLLLKKHFRFPKLFL